MSTQTFADTEAAADTDLTEQSQADEADDPDDADNADDFPEFSAGPAEDVASEQTNGSELADSSDLPPDWALSSASATDHVRLLMEIVMGELRRPDHPHLQEIEPGRWWLRSDRDLAQTRPPLSDRLEWAVFGLLSASRGIGESDFFERVAHLFTGHDAPRPGACPRHPRQLPRPGGAGGGASSVG